MLRSRKWPLRRIRPLTEISANGAAGSGTSSWKSLSSVGTGPIGSRAGGIMHPSGSAARKPFAPTRERSWRRVSQLRALRVARLAKLTLPSRSPRYIAGEASTSLRPPRVLESGRLAEPNFQGGEPLADDRLFGGVL